jgi:cytochrome c556
MRCLCWSLVATAVVMTLSAGCANRTAAAGNSPQPVGTTTPGTATPETARVTPSHPAAAKTTEQSQQAAATMTEQDYDAIMKKVGATYASMRKNLDSGEITGAATDPKQLAELFGEAEKFWAQHKKQDAVKWSQMARNYATDIADALTAAEGFLRLDPRIQRPIQARMARARTVATNLGDTCKQCHGTYREGDQAKGFNIKPGTLAR